MGKLLIASALLVGISLTRPAAAEAGIFFSFSQPGFGIAVGAPVPSYYYPPAPVVYVPPPVVYGGWHGHPHSPRCGHSGYAWGRGYRSRGYRWR